MDGETVGYGPVLKSYDMSLTERQFMELLDKIRVIKNMMAEIQAEKLRRKTK